MDVLHLLAVAGWLGGLATLLTALYRAPSIEPSAVHRFSCVAFICVVTLTVTGLYQSWRQVGSWSALTGTSYGQLLLAKVALVVVMVGVAWVSRRWTAQLAEAKQAEQSVRTEEAETEQAEAEPAAVTVPDDSATTAGGQGEGADPERAAQLARQQAAVATAAKKKARDADPVRSGLRRSVLAEAAVAVALLAVTTVLTSTEPGRTEEEAARITGSSAQGADAPAPGPAEITLPFDTGGQNGKGTVRLTLGPASPGANEMHLYLTDPAGKPMEVPEVKVSFTLVAKQIGPLPIRPDRLPAGHWSAAAVQIPMPGEWQVQVTVRTSDIDQATIDKNVKIG